MATSGGFTGKTLRVNLTTRTVSTEDTLAKYGKFWGGAGMGYQVLWEEVPAGTDPLSPGNRLIIGWGPMTGTGAPSNGRTTVTAMSAVNPWNSVTSGHLGGYFAAEAKYAGWDGMIFEGKASGPVWVAVNDDQVKIIDAPELAGVGLYRKTAEISELMGKQCQVISCGTAGENMVAHSSTMNGRSHSGGSNSAVWGSKNLLAVGCIGTGSVKVAASKKQWRAIIENAMALIGGNNQAVVPNLPQPWAEYVSASGVRWWASKGRFWGAAHPPVETGTANPHDRQSVGYRSWKCQEGPGADFKGDVTVRMEGCHACPIRCHACWEIPSAEKWGVTRYSQNTCSGTAPYGLSSAMKDFDKVEGKKGPKDASGNLIKLTAMDFALRKAEANVVGISVCDDLCITQNYALNSNNFPWFLDAEGLNPGYKIGELYIKPNVSAAEWTRLNAAGGLFDLYVRADLRMYFEYGRIVGTPNGTPLWPASALGKMLGGPQEWAFDNWKDASGNPLRYRGMEVGPAPAGVEVGHVRRPTAMASNYWGKGHPEHHLEGWPALMFQVDYNRDPQQHSWSSTAGNTGGLPRAVGQRVFESQFLKNGYGTGWGESASQIETPETLDLQSGGKNIMPRASKWAHAQKELIDAMGLCAWMYPFIFSPLKERGYEGDLNLLAKYWNAATGDTKTTIELDQEGERMWMLHRLITIRDMKAAAAPWGGAGQTMRAIHDTCAPFEDAEVHELWDHMMDLYYAEWGLDTNGHPTRATLDKYGMNAYPVIA